MRMLGRWSLLGFSVAIAAPGMIAARAPGADWRGTWMLYGIAAGLFAAVLWLLLLEGHFRIGRMRLRMAATVSRWNRRRNVRVGPVKAQAGTSTTSARKTANSAPQRAQTSRDATPTPGTTPGGVVRVPVPAGASVTATLRAFAERHGMTAYYSDSEGYFMHDGAQTYPCELVTA